MNELNISELIEALRSVSVPVVPFEHQWFDLEQLSAYLNYEKSHVQQRVIGLPGFPQAVKCGRGKRWRAKEICKWLESQKPAGRPRKSA